MGGLRTRWAAIGAAIAVVLGGGGLLTTSASLDSGERGVYVPITPCRVMDTRPATDNVGPRSTPVGADETHAITVRGTNGNCTIPTDAVGLVLNVAVINPSRNSFLTVYPPDATRPLAANANWTAGQPPLSNAVTTDISADGRVAFYNLSGTVDLAADILGYYTDHTHDDRYPTDAEVDAKIAAAVAAAPAPAGAARVLVDAAGTTAVFTSMALSAAGNPVISYVDQSAADVKLAMCSRPDCTGAITIRTLDADASASQTGVVIPADGRPVVVYTQADGDLYLARCADTTCSSVGNISLLTVGNDASIVVGSSGFPIVAYHQPVGLDLRVAACNDANCGSLTQSTIDHQTGITTGQDTAIALGLDGNPVIAYLDLTNVDLRVARCGNATCSTVSTTLRTVDSAGSVGSGPSIAIGTDGNPVISYIETAGSEDLKFAACVDAACDGPATIHILDAGLENSIAIGADGFPIIAYDTGGPQYNLGIVKCGTRDCSGGRSLSIVEAANDVGTFPDMAIDARGVPVISHIDGTNGDLRVAKCASATCLP